MGTKRAVVIGGGIAGILSAILVKDRYDEVVIVEKNSHLGGLVYSYRNEQGIEFDFGTHIATQTGKPELDKILFGDLDPSEWITMDYAKTGCYYRGILNEKSPFVDTRLLPQDVYSKGMMELLNLGENPIPYEDLESQLQGTFGPTFTEEVFRPVMRKFCGKELNALAPDTHNLFQLSRLTGLTEEATRLLKKSPIFDEKLGYHSYKVSVDGAKKYYPKRRGMSLWIETLIKQLDTNIVRIMTGKTVNSIHHDGGEVQSIVLNDGTRWECDLLIWTAPVSLCLKAAEISAPGGPPPQTITGYYHLVFDQPFTTDLHYCTCYDPDVTPFRITFYPNIAGAPVHENHYHMTAEVLSTDVQDSLAVSRRVVEDLKRMRVVQPSANLVFQKSTFTRAGFVVRTHEFVRQSQEALQKARSYFKNAVFAGKEAGSSFTIVNVLKDVDREIHRIHSAGEVIAAV
jgi:protoporphyrinogen oxidase